MVNNYESVTFEIPVGLNVCLTSMSSHLCRHKCDRHLCQNKCFRNQNWHLECTNDLPSANNVYEWYLRTTANYNHTNIGKIGDSSCKICYFNKGVHYISTKIIFVSPALICGWMITKATAFLGVTIIYPVQVRLHCLVLTDTYLYNLPCKLNAAPIYVFVTSMLWRM